MALILEALEKLLNEHASSAVLRDHLALFKDQFALVDRDNVNLKTENTSLKSQVKVLAAENQKLRSKLAEAQNAIQRLNQETHKKMESQAPIQITSVGPSLGDLPNVI